MCRVCPNCASEMGREERKLGKVTKWYVCPSCGVREQINDPIDDEINSPEYQKKLIKQQKRDTRGYYDDEGVNTY